MSRPASGDSPAVGGAGAGAPLDTVDGLGMAIGDPFISIVELLLLLMVPSAVGAVVALGDVDGLRLYSSLSL